MEYQDLINLLNKFRDGEVEADAVARQLRRPPLEHLNSATLDHHRALRQGFPEVIFGAGKTVVQLRKIIAALLEKDSRLLATRISAETHAAILGEFPELNYHTEAQCLFAGMPEANPDLGQRVAILSGGTADIPVVREAELTLQMFGIEPRVFVDVGVAGIHRLDAIWPLLQDCLVLIVIAGMEGALPSVVAGLSNIPVLAVPTSQGYGTTLQGFTPLMAMLSSCAAGISVVNIDNGFGAAFNAALMVRQFARLRQTEKDV